MGLRKKMRKRWMRCAGCVAVLCCCGVLLGRAETGLRTLSADTKAGASKPKVTKSLSREVSAWEAAERGREVLEAIAAEKRTRADYTTAMDGFRTVYHDKPGDTHAPAAVFAVAELLTEQGRGLRDGKSLKAAVGQYEFLRVQYPGSSLRVAALLAQGQIYANDLGDAASARERFSLLVKQFPGSMKAEEARAGLEALDHGVRADGKGAGKNKGTVAGHKAAEALPDGPVQALGTGERKARGVTASSGIRGESVEVASGASALGAMPVTNLEAGGVGGGTAARGVKAAAGLRGAASGSGPGTEDERWGVAAPADAELDKLAVPVPGSEVAGSELAMPGPTNAGRPLTERRQGKLAQVTGIRHWSTATYTRVAIDLGDDVTFEAVRVPNPDRIYFDLHGTKLVRELVGKSFTVTDDGFLKKIRAAQFSNDMTRVVLDVNDVTEYSAFLLPNPYRLIIDIHGGREQAWGPSQRSGAMPQGDTAVAGMEVPAPRAATVVKSTIARPVPNTTSTRGANAVEIAGLSAQPGRVEATTVATKGQGGGSKIQGVQSGAAMADPALSTVAALGSPAAGPNAAEAGVAGTASGAVAARAGTFPGKGPGRGKKGRPATGDVVREDSSPARAAVPTADGETSLVRALGLKIGRIVIDAGHGGHDSGTIGVDGIEEKDVVLDVALRVGKMLHDRLGAEVVYTRSDDTFIPLETRTAIANKAQADLFLSIHANSSPDASARGVETYYLNFTSSPDSLETAARENAVSDQSIHQLSDLVKKIALKDKISESREFAGDVEASLYGGLQRGNSGLKDRGVKKAPFVVLIGANMPSILAEISFVTNAKDANQLQRPEYRQRVAESLYKGVAKYSGGLSGVRGSTERASVK